MKQIQKITSSNKPEHRITKKQKKKEYVEQQRKKKNSPPTDPLLLDL
jgi:hypothetical protein